MSDYEYTTGYPLTVYRGAQLLDEQVPGWEDEIDTLTLDMSNSYCCIVGQLFGDYTPERLGIRGSGAKYGFSLWGRQQWNNLTAWWLELIAERRARSDQEGDEE